MSTEPGWPAQANRTPGVALSEKAKREVYPSHNAHVVSQIRGSRHIEKPLGGNSEVATVCCPDSPSHVTSRDGCAIEELKRAEAHPQNSESRD